MKSPININTVFITDDAGHRRRVLGCMIAWGRPIHSITYAEALKPQTAATFTMVLLDLGPSDSGADRHLPRLKDTYPNCRMITITWHNTREQEIAVRRHGIACYLVASEEMSDLKAVVDHAAVTAAAIHPNN